MGGTHGFDMINRIKMNQEIKGKRSPFQKSTTSNNSNKKLEFKTPSVEDLKRLEISNQNFLKQQKRFNLIALTVSTYIALVIFRWVWMDWDWANLVVGFMKGVR
jgi:hypothetical protein